MKKSQLNIHKKINLAPNSLDCLFLLCIPELSYNHEKRRRKNFHTMMIMVGCFKTMYLLIKNSMPIPKKKEYPFKKFHKHWLVGGTI